jgi:hypothetical protein
MYNYIYQGRCMIHYHLALHTVQMDKYTYLAKIALTNVMWKLTYIIKSTYLSLFKFTQGFKTLNFMFL